MGVQPGAAGRLAQVAGVALTEPAWLSERITELGTAWGVGRNSGASRIAGTLWWGMAASALVDPIVVAYSHGGRAPDPVVERLRCEIRSDGGIERITNLPAPKSGRAADAPPADAPPGDLLRESLHRVVPAVAEVSGAGAAALWAVVADAIGNRAIDAGDPDAGARLAAEVGDPLPRPRFLELKARTFVRRISCCLIYEVPGCRLCTSCPKRPPAEREQLLTELARRG